MGVRASEFIVIKGRQQQLVNMVGVVSIDESGNGYRCTRTFKLDVDLNVPKTKIEYLSQRGNLLLVSSIQGA